MNTQLQSLKTSNQELFSICDNIDSYFSHIEHKLKVINSEFVVLSKLNKATLHSYCLDSIQFQSRLYTHYIEHFKMVYNSIQNQIYRDYYKLYKLIARYIHSHITDKKVLMLVENDTFPIYKDLEIFLVYEKQTRESIYDTLINIILALNEYCHTKQEFLVEQKKLADRGYDIENLISSHNYTKEVIEKHIELYYDYLCYFKKYKKKYLNELYAKITTLYYEIPPIEIMKNMETKVKTINDIDTSNNSLNNDNLLPFLPPSPNKTKEYNNNNNNNTSNIKTFINEIPTEIPSEIPNKIHINTSEKTDDGYLVTPTNSEVSSLNSNNQIINENISSEKSSNLSENNISENDDDEKSEINSIINEPIIETPKKKRGRPKKNK